MSETIADVDDTCITKPFDGAYVFSVSSSMGNLAYQKFLVVLSQEDRNMVVHVLDFSFVEPLCIFRNVFLIVKKELVLHLERAAEVSVTHEHIDYGRHPSDGHVFTE